MQLWVSILIGVVIIVVVVLAIYFLTRWGFKGTTQPPSEVTIFDIIIVGNSKRVTWVAPSGSGPLGYVYTITNVNTNSIVEGGNTNDTSVPIDGPNYVTGQQYEITVITKNSAGQSQPSTFVFSV